MYTHEHGILGTGYLSVWHFTYNIPAIPHLCGLGRLTALRMIPCSFCRLLLHLNDSKRSPVENFCMKVMTTYSVYFQLSIESIGTCIWF